MSSAYASKYNMYAKSMKREKANSPEKSRDLNLENKIYKLERSIETASKGLISDAEMFHLLLSYKLLTNITAKVGFNISACI